MNLGAVVLQILHIALLQPLSDLLGAQARRIQTV